MKRHALIVGAIIVAAVAGIVGLTFGVSNNVSELAVEIKNEQVDAVLASAEVVEDSIVSVPIVYYDQVMDECVDIYDASKTAAVKARQFEWSSCGYYNRAIERDLVEPLLNRSHLPVGKSGKILSNYGLGAGFSRWFNTVEGKSKNYASTIDLKYAVEKIKYYASAADSEVNKLATFTYENEKFYPLDKITVPDESVNTDGHNHLFTFNLGLPVEVNLSGDESFEVTADDDTWVYVNDKLVLDMGGVHAAATGRFEIHENGEIYAGVGKESLSYAGVLVNRNETAVIRIFHADRDSAESVFKLKMSGMLLNVVNANLAKSDAGTDADVEVAFNPEDLEHAVPLGESVISRPDKSGAILISMMAQAFTVVALVVVVMTGILVLRRQTERRKPE